jgi:two-component system response regulator HydG
VDIILPPLRERREDISLLAKHFLTVFNNRMKKDINGFSDSVMELLFKHSWPGNIRELEHVIERAYVLCAGDTITSDHLPQDVISAEPPMRTKPETFTSQPTHMHQSVPLTDSENEVERLLDALRRTAGNKAKAARLLGMDRSTLYRKISSYKIDLADLDVNE